MQTVLQVSDSAAFGGTERMILDLIAGLDRDRWRCVLMHTQRAGSPLVEGVRRLGVRHVKVASAHGLKGLAELPEVMRRIRRERPALVHAHLTYPLSCKFSLLAAAMVRVPAIAATAHLFVPLPATLSARAHHRLVASLVDRYIAVSRHVATAFHERLRVPQEKITVVYNGVAPSSFVDAPEGELRRELSGGTDLPVILTPARLDPQKGHRLLLDAATHVPKGVFVFAGDGPERAHLEERARALGLQERVRFLGHRRDVPRLLAACDIVVLASLYEGLPVAALEAMAAGRPVVATAIGGTDEAVIHGETGILVPAGNAVALAAAIRILVENPELRRCLGSRGGARVAANFCSAAMVEKVAAVYDDLVG
jgi:glycosyltransferase involved in cell wall biosynthesis